jgi:hypothetical protein
VADNRAALVSEHGDQVAHPGGVGAQRVVAARLRRAAVADQVGGDHRVSLGEARHHLAPCLGRRGDPVQQDDQLVAIAGGLEADPVSVQLDLLVLAELGLL